MLLAARAFVVKKCGCISGESTSESSNKKLGQMSWSKYGGAAKAWQAAKQVANFV